MKIAGIGVDIVESARIAAAVQKHGDAFLQRVFTEAERQYCAAMRDPTPHYAARFAAKEAVAKAFGTGIGEQIGWLEIEVRRDDLGRPSVALSGAGQALAESMAVSQVMVSLSHAEHYAVAQALLIAE